MTDKEYAIQTKTTKQAEEIAKNLKGVLFSDEDDTMFEARLTRDQVEALSKDKRIKYLSEL